MLKLEDYISDRPDLDYPNFAAWLQDLESRYPEREAIRFRSGKERSFTVWTFGRLGEESRRIGRGLLAMGLSAGDRVALWAENRPEWCAVWLGAVIAGLVIVPLDFLLKDEEAANILALSRPRALFLSGKKAAALPLLRSRAPSIEAAVLLEGEGEANYASFGRGSSVPALPSVSALSPEDAASIIFTSGTTGLAKGVVLSHRGIIANASAALLSLPVDAEDVIMTVLPLHHSYPTTCSFIGPLSVGASITIVEKLVGKVVIDDVRDSAGSILIAVPLLYDKVKAALEQGFAAKGAIVAHVLGELRFLSLALGKLGLPGFGRALFRGIRAKAGLGSLRLLVAGGGPLNPSTADFFDSLGFSIVQGYGMSENGPLITTNTPRHKNNASAGLPVKYTELRIGDSDASGVGEILVRSPSLMKGYFENPEATAEIFTEEGFLRTGDLGRFDKDGFLFITGRKKNLIVTGGGKNIYPEEIEGHFEGSRIVDSVLVLGRRKPGEAAEEVFAVIHPNYEAIAQDHPGRDGEEAYVAALVKREVAAVNRGLEPYKKISDFAIRREEFETTATKKIKRFLYKDYAQAT